MQEMPAISSSAYGTTTSTYADLTSLNQALGMSSFANQMFAQPAQARAALMRGQPQIESIPMTQPAAKRRIVQVLIADPNENVPLDQMLLHKGIQKLTDATDQELFFEIPINDLLNEHNKKRVTFIDKKIKERT